MYVWYLSFRYNSNVLSTNNMRRALLHDIVSPVAPPVAMLCDTTHNAEINNFTFLIASTTRKTLLVNKIPIFI